MHPGQGWNRLLPSKQWVHMRSLGRPIDSTRVSSFNGIEFERCEIETLANFVNKSVVFRRVGGGILVEILVWVAFKVAYYSASEELHVALG